MDSGNRLVRRLRNSCIDRFAVLSSGVPSSKPGIQKWQHSNERRPNPSAPQGLLDSGNRFVKRLRFCIDCFAVLSSGVPCSKLGRQEIANSKENWPNPRAPQGTLDPGNQHSGRLRSSYIDRCAALSSGVPFSRPGIPELVECNTKTGPPSELPGGFATSILWTSQKIPHIYIYIYMYTHTYIYMVYRLR